MRVIRVTPGYYPIKGGTETIVQNLAKLLNKNIIHISAHVNMDA